MRGIVTQVSGAGWRRCAWFWRRWR